MINQDYSLDGYNNLIQQLYNLSDTTYREFHSKLIPGITSTFIGVRTPILRKIAKKILKSDYKSFLTYSYSSDIYEITMLSGMVIALSPMSFEEKLSSLDKFIPNINNWAICDIVIGDLKCIHNNLDTMFNYIQKYLNSSKEYELRFAIVVLLQYYINDNYINNVLTIYDNIHHEGYYVKMAIAWGISICYIKYPIHTLKYIKNNNLDKFTHNKAIQKIKESTRVSQKDKQLLNNYKRN